MATSGGKHAVGDRLSSGCLAAGVRADFVCFDRQSLEFPYAGENVEPVELLLTRGTWRNVMGLYVGGKLTAGRETGHDRRVQEAGCRLRREIERRAAEMRGRGVSGGLVEALRVFYAGWEND
jgi:cytosine/adenosine deaminase-related metal-dependent hydrolase